MNEKFIVEMKRESRIEVVMMSQSDALIKFSDFFKIDLQKSKKFYFKYFLFVYFFKTHFQVVTIINENSKCTCSSSIVTNL